VVPKRRDWAISLGLLDSGCHLTESGSRLLASFEEVNLKTPTGAYVVWPLTYELTQLNIVPSMIAERPMDSWTFFGVTTRAFGIRDSLEDPSTVQAVLITTVHRLYELYRSLNPTRAPLRSELPIPVAYLAYSALCVAAGGARLDLPGVIREQRKAPRRFLDYRSSKRMEGAIILRVNRHMAENTEGNDYLDK